MMNEVLGSLVADKYRVDSLIREDGSGDLYSGVHEVLGRPVILKILPLAVAVDQRWVKRFVADARAASTLADRHILNITDFGTDARGISYAVFETVDGKTLRDAMDAEPQMDEGRALNIARQIAAALSAAHAKDVVHGSLAPSNVFIDSGDAVKVYGFGSDPLNVAYGSDVRYLAPEQCTPYPAADNRSDVYSLAALLYEMLGGSRPFEGTTPAEVNAKQNSEPPPPLSAFRRDLHPDLEAIVLSAMAVDPERRYQDVTAFAEDLATLSSNLGLPVENTAAAAAAAGQPVKRNFWQTAAFVSLGIAIFAAALIYATSVRQTDPTQALQVDAASLPVQPIGPATGAQEETLAKMAPLTEAEIMANSGADMLPGGDGYNAWANGGFPQPGAPLAGSVPGMPSGNPNAPPLGYVPPGGTQMYNVDGSGGSQFMQDNPGGVEIVNYTIDQTTGQCIKLPSGEAFPCPGSKPPVKAAPTPKAPAANTATGTDTETKPPAANTDKSFIAPPGTRKPAPDPKKDKPATPAKPNGSGAEPVESPSVE